MFLNLDGLSNIFEPKNTSSLTEDQKRLFHGFEELGGDSTKYQESAEWFENQTRKMESMTLCIIMLDKPANWLFSGISNVDKKEVLALQKKIDSYYSQFEEAKETEKIGIAGMLMRNIEDEELIEFQSHTGGTRLVINPPVKLCLDTALLRSMSTLSVSDLASYDDEQVIKIAQSRSLWKEDFINVNVSRMKRCALMYLEMCPMNKMISIARIWVRNKDGRPSSMTKFGDNEETQRIMRNDCTSFLSDKSYWKNYKKTFDIKIPRDGVTEELDAYEPDGNADRLRRARLKFIFELPDVPDYTWI